MRRVLIPGQLAMGGPAALRSPSMVVELGGATMGTSWTVKLAAPIGQPLDAIARGIQAQLDQVVGQMSTWRTDSSLSRFNDAAAGSEHLLEPEFLTVLRCALDVARDSGGACDPTLGALVDLWGFGPAAPIDRPPPPEAVRQALSRGGWRRLELDPDDGRARQPGGMRLDLSAIAKGFGVDQVARYLRRTGYPSHLVEVGGELSGSGCKPDGSPWWVALERPAAEAESLPENIVALHGLAVATSGDYRRYFDCDGRRYAHTIDPRTGYPVRHAPASVSVLHESCMWADAYATAITVLGPGAGFDYACRRGLAAVLIARTADGFDERLTPALAAMLE